MNDDIEMTQKYSFSAQQDNVTDIKHIEFPFGTTWPVVLESFLSFLEATGYVGVKEKVRVQSNPWIESDWTLGLFDAEDDWK
jgi:hypothetical protein